MTKQEAISQETMRYVVACRAHELRAAHIHLLALGRLRGRTVAAWSERDES